MAKSSTSGRGRPQVRPESMTKKEFNDKSVAARRRAASALQELHAIEYHRLIDEERLALGLPPSSHYKTVIRETASTQAPTSPNLRYFILAENFNVHQKWCKAVGLEPNGKNVYYMGGPQRMSGLKINLATDRIVFIAGWRSKKSLRTQTECERALEVMTMHTWKDIMASHSVIFIDEGTF